MSGQWTRHRDQRLEEVVHEARLPDGPAVFVLPLRGFGKKYAAFATRFGSIDDRFRLAGRSEPSSVPAGVAHFLEHQMFAQKDGDAFNRFAELGASANAFTSYTFTQYLFSTTGPFEPALSHLLDFVQQPYFTDAGTAKERGIIQQEIRQYDDHPGWRLRRRLHAGLFRLHPARIDIAGTVESVGAIDTEVLRLCYDTFYHPANMVVSVTGDVDPERVLQWVEASVHRHPRPPWTPPERLLPDEPAEVSAARCEDEMAVARPILAVGFKERQSPTGGRAQLRRDALTQIGLDAVFGPSSPFYQRLYEAGLIDRGFGAGYYGERTFGLSQISGETDRPEELAHEIHVAAERVRREGVSAADCERQRKSKLGGFVREFDSPEALGTILGAIHFAGANLFDYREELERITPDDVAARLAEHLDTRFATTALIRPRPGGA